MTTRGTERQESQIEIYKVGKYKRRAAFTFLFCHREVVTRYTSIRCSFRVKIEHFTCTTAVIGRKR